MLKKAVEIEDGKNYVVIISFLAGTQTDPNTISFGTGIGKIDLQLGQGHRARLDLATTAPTRSQQTFNPDNPVERTADYLFVLDAVVKSDDDKFLKIYSDIGLRNAVIEGVSVRELDDTELITNGTFDGSATGWTLNSHWTYGSNKISRSTGGGLTYATQDFSHTADDYLWTFDAVGDMVVFPTFGGFAILNGTYHIVLNFASVGTTTLQFGSSLTASVDNVSMKKIIGADLVQADGWILDDGWESADGGLATGYQDAEFELQQNVTIEAGATYRLSFDINGLFADYLIGDDARDQDLPFYFGRNTFPFTQQIYNAHLDEGHVTVDAVADGDYDYLLIGDDSEPSTYGLLILQNVSFKKVTDGVAGPELLINGDFSLGLEYGGDNGTGWDPEDKSLWGIHNPNFIFLRRIADGTLPSYSTSLLTAVKRVEQGLSHPKFIFGGRDDRQ